MYPLSDKELDRLSREAAEQYDVESSTLGWEQVENKLNKVMPTQKEKDRRRFVWMFFLLFLLGGAGLSVILINGNNKEQIAGTDNNKLTLEKENTAGTTKPNTTKTGDNSEKINPKESESSQTISSKKEDHSLTEDGSNKEKAKAENLNKNITDATNTEASNYSLKNSFSATEGKTRSQKRNSRKAQTNLTPTSSVNTESSFTIQEHTGNVESSRENEINPSSVQSIGLPNLTAKVEPTKKSELAEAIHKLIASNSATTNTGKNKYTAPIAIGIVLGSDQSRIHGTTPGSFGWSTGLTVQYDLTKRLSVNTGFTITKKFYEAKSKDFHPPQHYWTSYVNLQSVIGDCQMWEIPVQVRYDLSVKKSTRLFVNSGISNYIMRRQSYQYHYLNSNNVMAVKDWETYSQSNYWLGIMNVSAGIEKNLNRSFSFQMEPYVKIPLKGVGFGNMDISSYGLLLSLRYRPIFRNK